MTHEALTALLTKFIENQCSEKETSLVFELLDDESNQAYFNELIAERLKAEVADQAVDEGLQRKLDKGLNALITKINQLNIQVRRKFMWPAIAGAAVLLIVASALYFSSNSGSSNFTKITKPAVSLIFPGGNKAILTIADGRDIILDSVKEGEIAMQSNISIKKTNSGQLNYHMAGPDTGIENDIPVFNTLTIPRGGQYQLILSDGTEVWLNAGSSLKFPARFSDKERVVELTGEAYFKVMKIPGRVNGSSNVPFIVKSDHQQIEVLGTEFNVNAYTEEKNIKTTLLKGSVKVSILGITGPDGSKLLKPGQQADFSKNHILISEGNTEAATAWKNGLFQFEDEDIHVIMREISRWYDVDIEYSGAMDNKIFSGVITKYETVDKVLRILTLTKSVSFKIKGRKIIVS